MSRYSSVIFISENRVLRKAFVQLVLLIILFVKFKSRDSSVGIVTDYGLDDRMVGFRIPARAGNFSLHHRDQTDSGAHPASHSMGTWGSFPGRG
jgi:hypothetical protein